METEIVSQSIHAETEYLTAEELSNRWNYSKTTLSNWRKKGFGPKFYKKGYRSYAYLLDDVIAFEKENPGILLK